MHEVFRKAMVGAFDVQWRSFMSTEDLWERAKGALQDVLTHTVNTPTYPDGPCMDKDIRDDVRALLADMKRVECVEGGAVNVLDEPGGVLVTVTDIATPPENATDVLLLLLPEADR